MAKKSKSKKSSHCIYFNAGTVTIGDDTYKSPLNKWTVYSNDDTHQELFEELKAQLEELGTDQAYINIRVPIKLHKIGTTKALDLPEL